MSDPKLIGSSGTLETLERLHGFQWPAFQHFVLCINHTEDPSRLAMSRMTPCSKRRSVFESKISLLWTACRMHYMRYSETRVKRRSLQGSGPAWYSRTKFYFYTPVSYHRDCMSKAGILIGPLIGSVYDIFAFPCKLPVPLWHSESRLTLWRVWWRVLSALQFGTWRCGSLSSILGVDIGDFTRRRLTRIQYSRERNYVSIGAPCRQETEKSRVPSEPSSTNTGNVNVFFVFFFFFKSACKVHPAVPQQQQSTRSSLDCIHLS